MNDICYLLQRRFTKCLSQLIFLLKFLIKDRNFLPLTTFEISSYRVVRVSDEICIGIKR